KATKLQNTFLRCKTINYVAKLLSLCSFHDVTLFSFEMQNGSVNTVTIAIVQNKRGYYRIAYFSDRLPIFVWQTFFNRKQLPSYFIRKIKGKCIAYAKDSTVLCYTQHILWYLHNYLQYITNIFSKQMHVSLLWFSVTFIVR